MTYVLGWRVNGAVYLAADSVMTTDRPKHPLVPSRSTFGELHIDEEDRSAHEGLLKVITLEDKAAAVICGDVGTAIAVVENFRDYLAICDRPSEAFERAVQNNGPYPPEKGICLLAAVPGSSGPELSSFDSRAGNVVPHYGELVQYGSMPPGHKLRSAKYWKSIIGQPLEPSQLLVSMLAILQSYGIHDCLIKEGVGGPFSGIYLTEGPPKWQKDILYFVYDDDETEPPSFCIIRDNVLIARSIGDNSCRTYGYAMTTEEQQAWLRKWWDAAPMEVTKGKFDYVVWLNKRYPIVTVVEFLGHSATKEMTIAIDPAEVARGRLGMRVTRSDSFERTIFDPLPTSADGTRPLKFTFLGLKDENAV